MSGSLPSMRAGDVGGNGHRTTRTNPATDSALERPVRLGVVQMDAVSGDPATNIEVAEGYIAALAGQGANLVVLPELFISGYDLDTDMSRVADPAGGPHTEVLTHWARRYDLVLATAMLGRTDEGELVDRAIVVDQNGVAATASKQYLWGGESEIFIAQPGPSALAETSIGKVGVAICYEAGFPEVVRELAVRGAEIIAIPAAFGRQRLYAWELLTRSRALENGCFVAAAGLTGTNASGTTFAAHSRVVSTRGEVLAGLGDNAGVAVATVDLEDIGRARGAIPYLQDLARRDEESALTPYAEGACS